MNTNTIIRHLEYGYEVLTTNDVGDFQQATLHYTMRKAKKEFKSRLGRTNMMMRTDSGEIVLIDHGSTAAMAELAQSYTDQEVWIADENFNKI